MNLELETQRLLLKPLAETDTDIAIELFTDPEVVLYAGGVASEQEIRDEIKSWTARGGNGCIGIWCIYDQDTAEKYGTTYLLPTPINLEDTNWDLVQPGVMPEGDIEVGYYLKRDAWGKGIATEVCQRLLQFAFEQSPLLEVAATLEDENLASKRVLEKAGLTLRGRILAYGGDQPIYRISREQWAAR